MTTAARTATPLDPSSTRRVDDTRMKAIRPLITPALLQEWLPAPDTTTQLVEDSRAAVCRILSGQDDRLLVVVGPCSIHDHAQAMDYARQLKAQADALSDDLLILMRVYFEKPRTTVGWKGYINDPHMDDSYAINQGLEMARRLLLDVLQLGMPVATEFLDLLSPQFISELISWGAIGARTTESQSHRQLASGLSCPVGFKNGTDGGVKVAADAILAAQASHAFMGITKMGVAAIFETHGNPYCHIILRGGKVPNYDRDSVKAACVEAGHAALACRLMIDCSHGNSQKKPENQVPVAQDIAEQLADGESRIFGVMVESNIAGGREDLVAGRTPTYGRSITDGCLDWDSSVTVLEALAEGVSERRLALRRG